MALQTPAHRREAGFAMVALLVGMSVAAVWMSAALPAWRQQTLRQKEEDLIFRGEQYARAIVLFQSRNRNALPPSIDVLVSGRYLRKKWKDPITNEDFVLLGSGIQSQGTGTPQTGAPQAQTPGRGGAPGTNPQQGQPGQGQQAPGITGVRSGSTATSIKVYQNFQVYSQWPFDAALIRARMGRPFQQNPGGQPGGQPGRQGTPGDRQPGRGGQEMGPIQPGRGGPDRPGAPGSGGAPPPPGRAGGSYF